jgi:hypothetical protein
MSRRARERSQEIWAQQVGNSNKRVLLVEGTDDVEVYRLLFNCKFPAKHWEQNWILSHAGGKQPLIEILAKERTWLGLIDRDEWSEDRILREQKALSNLLLLPRFCMENYLICPDEIWETLSENQRTKITGGLPRLKAEILADKDKWIRHCVLWSVINPLWEGLKALGFKSALLDFNTAQNDAKIQEILNKWYALFEPYAIFIQFQKRLNLVMAKSESEQLRLWVHGKQFYHSHVHQVLNQFLGQESAVVRRYEIFRTCRLPNELDFVYQKMGLLND